MAPARTTCSSASRRLLLSIPLVALLHGTGAAAGDFGRAAPCSDEFHPCALRLAQQAPPGQPASLPGPPDRRVQVAPDQWPWSSIGQINVVFGPAQRGMCTGTLTGPRQVVTAAHCLFNTRMNDWAKPANVHFQVGQPGEKSFKHSVAENFVVSPQFKYRIEDRPRYDLIAPDAIEHDWAIVSLVDALDLKPVPIRPIQQGLLPAQGSGDEVALAGYGIDHRFILSVHKGCAARIRPPDAGPITHSCEAVHGVSGGPILLLHDGNAMLIGVHSSVEQQSASQAGYPTAAGRGAPASAFEKAASGSK
jgi:protease YdgD